MDARIKSGHDECGLRARREPRRTQRIRISNSSKYSFAFSPRDPREFCLDVPSPGDQRAQGMPGARCARSLACEMKKAHERSHHGHTGITRHSPRNGFTAYNALSPVTGLSCHRRLRMLPQT